MTLKIGVIEYCSNLTDERLNYIMAFNLYVGTDNTFSLECTLHECWTLIGKIYIALKKLSDLELK